MARKNVGETNSDSRLSNSEITDITYRGSQPKKNKKTNKKDIVKMLIPLIVAIIFIYVLYKIIGLIVVPTDIVMIENGTIYNEEDAIRICYKRRKNCNRK